MQDLTEARKAFYKAREQAFNQRYREFREARAQLLEGWSGPLEQELKDANQEVLRINQQFEEQHRRIMEQIESLQQTLETLHVDCGLGKALADLHAVEVKYHCARAEAERTLYPQYLDMLGAETPAQWAAHLRKGGFTAEGQQAARALRDKAAELGLPDGFFEVEEDTSSQPTARR